MTDALSELRSEIIRTWMVLFEEPGVPVHADTLDNAAAIALENAYQRGYDAEPSKDLVEEVQRLTTDLDKAYRDNVELIKRLDKANDELDTMAGTIRNSDAMIDDLQHYAELHNIDKIVGWIDGRYSKAL